MRIIDADALEKSLENSCKTAFEGHCFVNFMCYVDEQPTLNAIVFPQTIGNITFDNKRQLFKWIENQQLLNRTLLELY